MILDGLFDLWDWFKSLFKKKNRPEPKIIEHRGMKGYFSSEMIEEFENAKVDYEKKFREAVDEVLDDEEDDGNPYR